MISINLWTLFSIILGVVLLINLLSLTLFSLNINDPLKRFLTNWNSGGKVIVCMSLVSTSVIILTVEILKHYFN